MMKKYLCLFTSVLLAALALTGCGGETPAAPAVPPAPKQAENLEITFSYGAYDEIRKPVYADLPGTYTGDICDGVPEGSGTFMMTESPDSTFTYEGDFVGGKADGQGTATLKTSDSPNEFVMSGTFTDGLYTPTKAEVISMIGQNDLTASGKFFVSSAGTAFIDEHNSLFPTTSAEEAASFAPEETELRKLKKTLEGFDDQLIVLHDMYVMQIYETFVPGYDLTELLLADADLNFSCVYYLGKTDYYEGDTIDTVYVLPLGNTGFDNISGGTTLCLAALGSYLD